MVKENSIPVRPGDRWLRILGIPVTTMVATFGLSGFFDGIQLLPVWQVFLSNLMITWVGWEISRRILYWTRVKYPAIDQVKTRLSIAFSLYFVVMVMIDLFIIWITQQLHVAVYKWTAESFFLLVVSGTIISMLIGSLYEAIYFFSLWKKTTSEKMQLKQENLQSQFESLKNQVNPHFLFNSLNSLSSLIESDKKKAIEFIHGMSQVYRYILESNENDVTTLKNEIDFIRSYFYLLHTRFGENLKGHISIPESCMNKRLPPLTLQILIENAVKHNVVSASRPLYLRISTLTENELIVSNNLQKRSSVAASNNFGLQNINNRYELLSEPPIKITEDEYTYCVSVPLLN